MLCGSGGRGDISIGISDGSLDDASLTFASVGRAMQCWLAGAQEYPFTDVVEIMGVDGRTAGMLLRRTHHE
eukprot:5591307-Pyramimonas_sp.AAC.1